MSFNVEIPFDSYRLYEGEHPRVDTFTEVQEIIRSVFDEPALPITRETIAQDVESWDSVMHVTLLLAVEDAFRMHFTLPEMAYLKNVGDLVNLIDSKRRPAYSVWTASDRAKSPQQDPHS